MGFLRKLGGMFGGGIATNESTRAGSLSRSRPTIPRTYPTYSGSEQDELDDLQRITEESTAADILADLDEEEKQLVTGKWIEATSSNVRRFKWIADNEELQIEYHDGSVYGYFQMTQPEAVQFLHAASKGSQVWDQLRQRGTVYGFKKPYVYYSGPSDNNRKWYQSGEQSRKVHGMISEAEGLGGPALGRKGGFGRKRGKRK